MLVSYQWLSEYIDLTDVSPQDLAEKLTRAGVEVETVIPLNKGIRDVVIGHVLECVQHPNADKLKLCQVDTGEEEPIQIVCGAPNVARGQKVPVAKVGAVLPGDFKIKKAKLRGEISQGMICSAEELGIEEKLIAREHRDGIMVLPDQLNVGEDALSVLGLDDHILELELTPNRSDCLSMIGVAYEVGAILDRDVQLPQVNMDENGESIHEQVRIRIEADDLCPRYLARKVKNVHIAPSPQWMQKRLIAAGIRPINNVVDVTNFVMLEYGQPLHAFDAQHVKDGHIFARRAELGEKVVTLDGQERTLSDDMLVIADRERVMAVAGVMGAAYSEVTEETTEVILESAYFSKAAVRSASRKLELRSEASLRFEKGFDPQGVQAAVDRAASLLQELADAHVLSGTAEDTKQDFPHQNVSLRLERLNQALGTNLSRQDVSAILARLSFRHEPSGQELRVEVPTRRPDVNIEEDLIEEVARLYGYDQIPTQLPQGVTTPGSLSGRQKLRRKVKQCLQGAGLHEVLTYSLTKEEYAQWGSLFEKNVQPIALSMPMSSDRSHMRTTLIPNLLEVAQYNHNHGTENTHIFEIGYTFLTTEKKLRSLPKEKEVVSGLITGLWQAYSWQRVKVPVDFYVVKGILEQLFTKLQLPLVQFEPVHIEHYHPGRTALMKIDGEMLGVVGQVHPQIQKGLDLGAVYAYEMDVDLLERKQPQSLTFAPLPKYPGSKRDLAVVVDRDVQAGHLQKTIEHTGAPLLAAVELFDVYEGERIASDRKSIAFSLLYQDPGRTLTDEEVSRVHEKVIDQLSVEWDAKLRE